MKRDRDEANEAHFAHLMSLPVVREGRMKTRDQVPYSLGKLATLSRKFTTTTYIKPNPIPKWTVLPTYADWLRSVGCTPIKCKRSRVQMFEESPPEAWRDYPQS